MNLNIWFYSICVLINIKPGIIWWNLHAYFCCCSKLERSKLYQLFEWIILFYVVFFGFEWCIRKLKGHYSFGVYFFLVSFFYELLSRNVIWNVSCLCFVYVDLMCFYFILFHFFPKSNVYGKKRINIHGFFSLSFEKQNFTLNFLVSSKLILANK